MITLFVVLGVFFFIVAIYPFTIYPWSLILLQALVPKRQSSFDTLSTSHLTCAICVCAYNEERVIERKIKNLLALRERETHLEILVYVDASSDRTVEILTPYASQIHLYVSKERRGKTHGMNVLASNATAQLLIFTDANVVMDINCVAAFKRYFVAPDVGCVCGTLVYTNDDASVTAASGSAYWRFEEAVKRLEMESGSMMGADGSVFAIRRSLHQPPPDYIIDDMYVSLTILCSGFRVVQANDARAYEESVHVAAEEFNRKIRIACQAFNVHRLLWPRLRELDRITLYKYVSHKLIRWFTIYFLALSVVFLSAALVTAGMLLVAVASLLLFTALLSCGHLFGLKPFAQIADVLLALLGAGVGVWKSLRGERYQTWTPASSVRR